MYMKWLYGIPSRQVIFQRFLENLLAGIIYVIVRLDLILVTDKSDKEYLRNLEEVLKRLSNFGLRLKKTPVFMATKVVYYGHKIAAVGIIRVKANMQAICETQRPQNKSQLKSYLVMINYYPNFLPRLPTILGPLYKELAKNKRWDWSAEQD